MATIKLHCITKELNVGRRVDINPDHIVKVKTKKYHYDFGFGSYVREVTELFTINGEKILIDESPKTIRRKSKKLMNLLKK